MEGDELLYIARRMAEKNLTFPSVLPDLSALQEAACRLDGGLSQIQHQELAHPEDRD